MFLQWWSSPKWPMAVIVTMAIGHAVMVLALCSMVRNFSIQHALQSMSESLRRKYGSLA